VLRQIVQFCHFYEYIQFDVTHPPPPPPPLVQCCTCIKITARGRVNWIGTTLKWGGRGGWQLCIDKNEQRMTLLGSPNIASVSNTFVPNCSIIIIIFQDIYIQFERLEKADQTRNASNTDDIKQQSKENEQWVFIFCLFVCLFVCMFVCCLFVCFLSFLFVCLFLCFVFFNWTFFFC